MRLSELAQEKQQAEEARAVTILKANGDEYTGASGEPTQFGVLGSDAKAYRDVDLEQTRKQWKRPGKITPEQWLKNRIELAASAIAWWSNVEDDAGQPIPCTKANAVTLLIAAPTTVLEQVEKAIAEHAVGFTERSPS
jgi:hypothetical protein